MIHRFADNLMMAARCANTAGVSTEVTTDPVSFDGYDRVSIVFNVHYAIPPGTAVSTLTWDIEVSNDGTDWVAAGVGAGIALPAGDGVSGPVLGSFRGQFARAKFSYLPESSGDGGTGVSITQFDMDAYFDHS